MSNQISPESMLIAILIIVFVPIIVSGIVVYALKKLHLID